MRNEHIILAILWIVFCFLHSLLAGHSVKRKAQAVMGRHFKHYRLLYTLFAAVFFIAIIAYQLLMKQDYLFKVSFFHSIAGWVLGLSGLLLMLVCIRKYFMNLSGVKSLVQEHAGNTLIISGVHRYVRHPLYLGTFAFIWGLFLLVPALSLLIANVIITGYTLIGIYFEESKLVDEFGESYTKYQQTVPRILPFRKPKRAR